MPKKRHAYVPASAWFPDKSLFISAAHSMRAYKADSHDPRHKTAYEPGRMVVANESMRTTAKAAIQEEMKKLSDQRKTAVGDTATDIDRQRRNLLHAHSNIVTLDEAKTPKHALAEGKIYIHGHGEAGSGSIDSGGIGRSLTTIGQATADIAHTGGWSTLDQRLTSCESSQASDWGIKRWASPMTTLDQGTLARLKALGDPISRASVSTFGYQGSYSVGASRKPTTAGIATEELHRTSKVGEFGRHSGDVGKGSVTDRDRQLAKPALKSAEDRYLNDVDDGVQAPGPSRPGGARMSVSATKFALSGDSTLHVEARPSMYRRKVR